MIDLPDLRHIEKLREDLWRTPSLGQAVVMIGSGMSLNAERIPGQSHGFPLWLELARAIYEQLYLGDGPEHEKKRELSISGLGATVVAREFEAVFGTQKLSQLINAEIPDVGFKPGYLHEKLLKLPWADVFTTNYDTLLERTAVESRNYQTIREIHDLPGSSQPRIFKLHGTLNASPRFIITDEDFRNYPKQFSPFVNSVQQALMENTMVLIGFSGDDPNFLAWTGWVRDRLGTHAPLIYLVTLDRLPEPKVQLLKTRNVVPIDLSPVVFMAANCPGKSPKAWALEWFIEALADGRPLPPFDWPNPGSGSKHNLPQALPLPPRPRAARVEKIVVPQQEHGKPQADYLKALSKKWTSERKSYPGWLIAPTKCRQSLWHSIEHELYRIPSNLDVLSPTEGLVLAHEFNWQIERCLHPLMTDWSECFEKLLISNPIEKLSAGHFGVGMDELEQAWMELAFAIIRTAREDFDGPKHTEWMERTNSQARRKSDWLSRWHYERCLRALWTLNQSQTRQFVQEWPATPEQPVWQLKRASILAELGDLIEAQTTLSDALRRIRSGLRGRDVSIQLLSEEGWCLRMLIFVTQALAPTEAAGEREEAQERWRQLRSFQCDPWEIEESIDLAVAAKTPDIPPAQRQVKDFDPLTSHRTFNFGGNWHSKMLPAFSKMRLFEDAGLPMRVGIITLGGSSLRNACRWVEQSAPHWSVSMVLRANAEDDLKDMFQRPKIAALAEKQVDLLCGWLVSALKDSVIHLPNSQTQWGYSFSERVVQILAELLSRIVIVLDDNRKDEVLQLAIEIHAHRTIRHHVSLERAATPLFKRLFQSATETQLLRWIPDMISFPLPEEVDDQSNWMANRNTWRDPMWEVEVKPLSATNVKILRAQAPVQRSIAALFVATNRTDGVIRQRALIRLIDLDGLDLLTLQQRQRLGESLWTHLNPQTGLPDVKSITLVGFLQLPSPKSAKAREVIKKRLLTRPVQYYVKKVSPDGRVLEYTVPERYVPVVDAVIAATLPLFVESARKHPGFRWSAEEVHILTQRVAEWWDHDKALLEQYKDAEMDPMDSKRSVKSAFARIVTFLARVTLPSIEATNAETVSLTERLIEELGDRGIPTLEAKIVLLLIRPALADSLAESVLNSMTTGDLKQVAVRATSWWVEAASKGLVPKPPECLIDELCQQIRLLNLSTLHTSLDHIAYLLRKCPRFFREEHLTTLCRGLDTLLYESEIDFGARSLEQDSRIPIEEKPDCRTFSVYLAAQLWLQYSKRKLPIPSILEKWREAAARDRLPEIRRAWDTAIDFSK